MRKNSTARKDAASTLVLTGVARLTVSRGRLHVEDGFGCLDTKRTLTFDLPLRLKRVIRIGKDGGFFTEEALRVLTEHGAALYAVTQKGELSYQIFPPDGPIRPSLLRAQARLAGTEFGLALAKRLIVQKVRGQEDTLAWIASRATLPGLEAYVKSRSLFAENIEAAESLEQLRQAEASSSAVYFEAWNIPLSFYKPESGCREVPSHWHRWEGRQSRKGGGNRDATDPVNALLNFGYALAVAEVMVACRAGSLEPSLGVLHSDKDGRASFAFDLVEPLRPVVDRLILEFVTKRKFKLGRDFIALRDGVCRVGVDFAAEVAKALGDQPRPKAEKIVTETRVLVQAANAPVPELRTIPPKLQEQARKQEEAVALYDLEEHTKKDTGGTCEKCGVWVAYRRKFCDPCRTERRKELRAEQSRQMWERWRAEGIDPSHSPEARRKMSEWTSQSNKLKPRKGYERKQEAGQVGERNGLET